MAEDRELAERSGELPTTAAATATRQQWLPGRRVWVFWLLCGAAVLAVRSLQIDMAVVNILTLVLAALALGMGLVWWCLFSSYSPTVRWLPIVLLVVAGTIVPVRYRTLRTSGSLIPKFIPRGAPTPDELLAPQPQGASVVAVDLATTGPDDFPQFLGPQGNSVVDHLRIDPDWILHPPRAVWRREIGAGWSGFAAVNGFAVTMEQRGPMEMVTCYEVATGQPCWHHALETRHQTVLGFIGPRGTPTIHGGKVYALGATGVLRCLRGHDGTLVWQRDLFADYGMTQEVAEQAVSWGRANSPLVIAGRVYVPIGGPRGGKCVSLLALDAETGETLWESGDHQASYASPAWLQLAGQPQIVMVNEDYVSSHDPESGALLWTHPWEGRSDMNANISQPHAVGAQQVFLSKGYGKGAELIEVTPQAEPPWDVHVVWSRRVMKTKFSNVAIRDGMAYGLDDGRLCCVDVQTGQRMWKRGLYKYGQILMVGELLLVMSEEGRLALVPATPDEPAELAAFQALEGQCWNTLCLYGSYLLVRNDAQAACYELKLQTAPAVAMRVAPR